MTFHLINPDQSFSPPAVNLVYFIICHSETPELIVQLTE